MESDLNEFHDSFGFRHRDLGIKRDIGTLLKLYLKILNINKTLTEALPCKEGCPSQSLGKVNSLPVRQQVLGRVIPEWLTPPTCPPGTPRP
jgi:hypothetical protein